MNRFQENSLVKPGINTNLEHAGNKNILKPSQKKGSTKLLPVTKVPATDNNGSVKTALVTTSHSAGNTTVKLLVMGDISTPQTTIILMFCPSFVISFVVPVFCIMMHCG